MPEVRYADLHGSGDIPPIPVFMGIRHEHCDRGDLQMGGAGLEPAATCV
jgi:hypothetical protein